MLDDWTRIEEPSKELVEALALIPGVKFESDKHGITAVRFHANVAPLLGVAQQRVYLPPTFSNGMDILRPYQRKDVPFILTRHASILGYEMRLGKTATASVCHAPSRGPLLIVGPLIARDVWQHWIEKIHGFSLVCLEGKQDIPLPGFPAYFVHYDILDSHSKFLQQQWGTLIIDEIHLLQARRSQRISVLSLVAPLASKIIGLSGTPMWSDPRSMWPLLNLLSPGAWGTEFEFIQRYQNASQTAYGWKYQGTRNETELSARLSEVLVRRTWKDVAPNLPPTINIVEPVSLGLGEKTKLEMQAERERLSAIKPHARETSVAALATLRKKFGLAKVKRAVELATDALLNGRKVVLWTWHHEVAEALHKVGPTAFKIDAMDAQDERAQIIRLFQNNPNPCAIIVPLAVGGVAIDLSSADINIFVEVDWIPATNYQASMRVFKPGRPHANHWLYVDVAVERNLFKILGTNEACQTSLNLGYDEVARQVQERMNGNG